jgi:rhamnogalacturonyl hydrolase YesR
MKIKSFAAILTILLVFTSCSSEKSPSKVIDESLAFSLDQYKLMAKVIQDIPEVVPRTLDADGKLVTAKASWWTSGFFPGSLWYLYEYSKDENIKNLAAEMSKRVEGEKYTTNNHDVGFMIGCSFGNGLRITNDASYREVMIQAAKSLSTRFRPNIGCIQSWGSRKGWQCPVIIDNMMNLELLMEVFKMTNDSSFYKIAVSHADTTMKNHFRSDFSTYHVVSYDTITGKIEAKQTAQGAADESAWARGQSWGLYGYTMMYRETKLDRYLKQAQHIADFLISHPNMPADMIPYWDYNAPGIPNTERDASAASIMASALIELSGYVDAAAGQKYLDIAKTQILNLSSPAYRAKLGENGNFILMHSVGSLPAKSEVNVPLSYADYYYIEALMRLRGIVKE